MERASAHAADKLCPEESAQRIWQRGTWDSAVETHDVEPREVRVVYAAFLHEDEKKVEQGDSYATDQFGI